MAVVAEGKRVLEPKLRRQKKTWASCNIFPLAVIPHQESLGNELKDEGRVVGGFNRNGCCTRTLYTVQSGCSRTDTCISSLHHTLRVILQATGPPKLVQHFRLQGEFTLAQELCLS